MGSLPLRPRALARGELVISLKALELVEVKVYHDGGHELVCRACPWSGDIALGFDTLADVVKMALSHVAGAHPEEVWPS